MAPGCNHSDHVNDPLFLHSQCHIRSGLDVSYLNGIMTIRCLKCVKHIISLKTAFVDRPVLRCHRSGFNVAYLAGELTITCKECGKVELIVEVQ